MSESEKPIIFSAPMVRALLDGRYHLSIADVHAVAPAALRHRIAPSFEAEADGLDADRIVAGILQRLPREAAEDAAAAAAHAASAAKGGAA